MTQHVNAEISNGYTMQDMKWQCEEHRACEACIKWCMMHTRWKHVLYKKKIFLMHDMLTSYWHGSNKTWWLMKNAMECFDAWHKGMQDVNEILSM